MSYYKPTMHTAKAWPHKFQLHAAKSLIAYTNSLERGGEKLFPFSFCINSECTQRTSYVLVLVLGFFLVIPLPLRYFDGE